MLTSVENAKVCSCCKIEKSLSEFNKDKSRLDGYQDRCKPCRKEYYQANRDRILEKKKEYQQANRDKISKKNKEYQQANRDKIAEKKKEYLQANRDRIKEYRQANRDKIAEKDKKYHQANRERRLEYHKEWSKNNPDKIRSLKAKRRAIKYQAYPMWARSGTYKKQIDSVYREARQLEKETGIPHHVDHIIPLQPPKVTLFEGELIGLVCGLHVPANLRAIPYDLNLSKSNTFEPYIESELKCRHTS